MKINPKIPLLLLIAATVFLVYKNKPAKVKALMERDSLRYDTHASDKFDSLQIEEMKWKDSTQIR